MSRDGAQARGTRRWCWHWLLGRSASESGTSCPVARAHGRGGRRQRGL